MLLQINFSFETYFRIPTIDIGVNNQTLYTGDVKEKFEFNVTNNKGPNLLWIKHRSKQPYETTNEHDTHVFIKNILFDDIDLDQLEHCRLTHQGRFYPEYNKDYLNDCIVNKIVLPEFISPNHYLGHNGIWKLDFEMPAMNWIIKKQNPSGINLEDTIFSSSNNTLKEIKDLFNL